MEIDLEDIGAYIVLALIIFLLVLWFGVSIGITLKILKLIGLIG